MQKGDVAGEGVDVFEQLTESNSAAEVEVWQDHMARRQQSIPAHAAVHQR
jgi:hypothetical protein